MCGPCLVGTALVPDSPWDDVSSPGTSAHIEHFRRPLPWLVLLRHSQVLGSGKQRRPSDMWKMEVSPLPIPALVTQEGSFSASATLILEVSWCHQRVASSVLELS